MSPAIEVNNLDSSGVSLTSPASPDFEATIQSLFLGDAATLLKLKPFLTIVTNHTENTVAAYSLQWEIVGGPREHVSRSHYNYPDAVAPAPHRGNELHPGDRKIVPMGIELSCGRFGAVATENFYLDQFVEMLQEYTGAKTLRISLDAVIFANGDLLGPDQAGLQAAFSKYVATKQNLYRGLVAALDSGMSLDAVFQPVDERAAARVAKMHAMDPRDELFDLYATQSDAELRRWRRCYGDGALPGILRRALLPRPFTLRRRPE